MRGPNGEELPGAVLFACTLNSVRSPMAAGLMRHLYGTVVFVDSVGVREGTLDPLAAAVMEELGLDISAHRPKSFEMLDDTSFDLIVSLSPEAHHRALELTRTMACTVEYWPTFDPTAVEGTRAYVLEAYRGVRDGLLARLKARFSPLPRAAV